VHTSRCSESVSLPRRCKCSCGGWLHGGLAPLPPMPGGQGAGQRVSSGAGGYRLPERRSAHPINKKLAEAIAAALDSPSMESAAVDEIIDAVERAVEQAVDSLPPQERAQIRRHYEGDHHGSHLVCGLLAAVVEALAPLAEADKLIAEAVVDAAIPERAGFLGNLTAELMKQIVSQVVQAVAHTALAKVKALVKLLRGCAVAICPTPEGHEAVRENCLKPLAAEEAGDAVRSELDKDMGEWPSGQIA
jgi:hypothetical protein